MKAALYDRHGTACAVLRIEEIEPPEPAAGEVRIRLHLSGVNPTDVKARSGANARPINGFQIPHHDGAGVIDAIGPGVRHDRMGQKVWVWMAAADQPWGTAAEFTVVSEDQAVPIPDGVSCALGATLGVPALTAYRCVFADGPVEGKTILVAGGAGAVGHFAIQLAKHGGARVITTVSNDRKAELAAAAGADLVVNYRDGRAAQQILAAAGPPDRVVEVALAANLELDLALARPGTVIAMYATEDEYPSLPLRPCMLANITLEFVYLYGISKPSLTRSAAGVNRALEAGALTEIPIHRFPLADVATAHEAAEAGIVGKVLVDMG